MKKLIIYMLMISAIILAVPTLLFAYLLHLIDHIEHGEGD